MDTKHLFSPVRNSALLLAALVAVALACVAPVCAAHATEYEGWDGEKPITVEEAIASADIKLEHYEALGLNVSPEIPENAQAPYPEDHATDIVSAREVYVDAAGASQSVYTVRDNLNVLGPLDGTPKGVSDSHGTLYGAYAWYKTSSQYPDSGHGGTTASCLSDNSKGVLKRAESDSKYVLYATSVAYSAKAGDSARDDHVAELRGMNGNWTQEWNGTSYYGGISICLYSLSETGERTKVGEIAPELTNSQINGKRLKYSSVGYLQELDAYFELKAADVDGDGIDELFAYTGAYADSEPDGRRVAIVYMMKSSDGKNYECHEVKVDAGKSNDYVTIDKLKKDYPDPWNKKGLSMWDKQATKTAPVVAIATGDLDRNGTEEVAITTSAPTDHGNVASAAWCYLFSWNAADNQLQSVSGLDKIALSAGDSGAGMVSANCSFGTFLIPNTSYNVNAFVIAGYQTAGATSKTKKAYGTFAYRYAYFHPGKNKYVVSDYTVQALGSDAKRIINSTASKADKTARYMPTPAPLALGCARLESMAEGVKGDHVLMGGDIYTFDMTRGASAAPIGSISIFSDHRNNEHPWTKDKDHVWIGDVVSGVVADDDLVHESFLAKVGIHRDVDLSSADDYYWLDIAHFTFEKGSAAHVRTGQEGVVSESARLHGSGSGYSLSLCLPDINDDSIRVRFKDKAVFATDPHVMAILQDAPYFSELDQAYHYLASSATTFGQGTETSEGTGFSLSFAAGMQMTAEVDVGLNIMLNMAGQYHLGYDTQRTTAESHEISYAAQGGKGDKVVVCSIPVVYYRYEVYDPDKKAWKEMFSTCPGSPVTAVVSVDTWNKVADDTSSLHRITNTVMSSESGDPDSYVGALGGEAVHECDKGYASTSTKTASEGGSVTQTIGKREETSEAIMPLGLSLNITTGFGGGFAGNKVNVGPILGVDAGFTKAYANASTTTFSGTVDNLPELGKLAAKAGAYGFDWKLVVNKLARAESDKDAKELDGVFLVGYDVGSVVRPKLPMVQGARVDGVTDTAVSLSWDASQFGGADPNPNTDAYAVGMLDADGSGEVSLWRWVAADSGKGRVAYTWTGCKPAERYQFVVYAVQGSWSNGSFSPSATSLPSPVLSVKMLDEGEVVKVDPLTQVKLADGSPVPAGSAVSAEYAISATWTQVDSAGAVRDRSGEVQYTWKKKAPGDDGWTIVAVARPGSTVECDLSKADDELEDQGVRDARGVLSAQAAGTNDTPASQGALGAQEESGDPSGAQDAQDTRGAIGALTASEDGAPSGRLVALSGNVDALRESSSPLEGQDASAGVATLKVVGIGAEHDNMLFMCTVGFEGRTIDSGVQVLHVATDDGKPEVASPEPLMRMQTSASGRLTGFVTSAFGPLPKLVSDIVPGGDDYENDDGDDGNDDSSPVQKAASQKASQATRTTPATTPKTGDPFSAAAPALALLALLAAGCLATRARTHPRKAGRR